MSTFYDLETPALLVDLTRLEANLAAMAAVAASGGKALRPHAKTHKTLEIARMQLALGATGMTVAKLGEAEVYADAGFTDIFVANEIVGPHKIDRLLRLLEKAHVRVGVDSLAVAEPLGAAASARGKSVSVVIETNTGHGRAGVRSVEEALAVGRFVDQHSGLELVGAFTHEGHLYRASGSAAQKVVAEDVAGKMRSLSSTFAREGLRLDTLSVGSTPGAPLLATEADITELRPGNYVFYDRMQVVIGAPADVCALTVLATVIGVHSDGRVLLDAGMKSLASDCPFEDKTFGEIVGKPDWKFFGASEEHGMIQLSESAARPKVGERVRIVPNHACTCVNMHDVMTVHQGEAIVDEWRVAARGKIR